MTVVEDGEVSHNVRNSFIDYDSPHTTIVVRELPANGILTYDSEDGLKEQATKFNQYNPYGEQVPRVQYAESVVAYSSNWYNTAGDWGPRQILGAPTTNAYTDTMLSWSPESKTGTGESKVSSVENEPGREAVWNYDTVFDEFGYTEVRVRNGRNETRGERKTAISTLSQLSSPPLPPQTSLPPS